MTTAGTANRAAALEVFATNIFSPAEGDEDPGLSGLMKIDLDTGVATTFIPEDFNTGFAYLSDVAVSPVDGLVYVSSQLGGVYRFDPFTGAPLSGEPGGFYRQLNGAGNGLLFSPDGTLYVAEIGQTGSVAIFDTDGVRQANGPTGLAFPAGMALGNDGELLIATGGQGELGSVVKYQDGVQSTLIPADGSIIAPFGLTILPPEGDYDGSGVVDGDDYTTWESEYGNSGFADGNGDDVTDAADYTVWRDNQGAESRLLTVELFTNRVNSFALDGTDQQSLIDSVPPEIPDPLPPGEQVPSNFPSEVLFTPDGTLLLSTLGLTRRPDNRGSLLEFDRDGNLLGTLAEGVSPISGIDYVPFISPNFSASVPEPTGLAAIGLALLTGAMRTRGRL